MKLNKRSKIKLREKIAELLKENNNGPKIKIEKNLLEELLFETVTVDKEKDIQVKLPVWSGDFLTKIDLSEVDFTNVSWYLFSEDMTNIKDFFSFQIDDDAISAIQKIQLDNVQPSNYYLVNYAFTNAKIDLSKSFEALNNQKIILFRCDFRGTDLSKQELSSIKKVVVLESSLMETKLPLNKVTLEASRSDLTNLDLSDKEIDALSYLRGDTSNLGKCKLINCGVKINLDPEDFKFTIRKKPLQSAMEEFWPGCYLNGKRVHSVVERMTNAQEIRKKYEEMENKYLTSVLDDIYDQIKQPKAGI